MATLINFDFPGSAENLRQFEEAMKHGHIRSWIWKLLLYGAAGSGKSSVKEMILGNPPPVTRTSTPLAMRPTTVYRVNLDGKEFTTITTLQERRAFLAQALLQSAPNLKRRLRAARAKVTSSSNNQPVSTVAVSQVQSKDQASPDQSKPPPLDDQPPSASLLEPASLDHRELDEDIDNEGDDILQLISTDQDLVKMMDRISTTVDQPASFRLLEIVDAGGQPQFHEILPIFLRRLSFYVFVFRLIDDLSTRPVVEYYSDAKAIGSSMTSSQTIEQLLQHCARTMHSHRASQGSEGDCPKIIVIGTHADKVWFFKGSNYDKKNAQILQLLQPMLGKQIIYYDASTQRVVFPVNSRTPASEDWSVIDQVRDLLLGEISIPPADIPARWFALEILLEEMAEALDQGVLSRQDCFTAAMKKLHFEEDAGEFDAAIHYLDELSVLLYYPRILPSVVFADPQVVLDKVTELVIASFERNASKCKGHSDSWRKFYEFALVTVEFLSQSDFNKHYVPGLFDVPDLIKLFKKLLIFAHFSATELLVPALLRDLDKKEVIKIRSSARSSAATPSFTIVFPDGGPRRGIYCSLLCWLVSDEDNSPAPWSIVTNKFGIPTCLHRNCVQFKLHKSPVVVTLIDTYTHFEIHINVPVEFSADLCPKIIPMVSQTIFKGLGKVALNLNYDGSSPSPALVCPCGRGDAHVAATNSKLGYWTCTQNVTLCGKLTSLQLLWLEQVTTDPSEAVEEVTTDPSKAATVALAYDRNTVFTGRDFSNLLIQLKKHATKWRDISAHLGFYPWELDNIQARPFLMQTAPESWLGAMLTEWLQRTPDDTRRSSSIESLTHALSKCGIETKLYDTSEYPLSKLHSKFCINYIMTWIFTLHTCASSKIISCAIIVMSTQITIFQPERLVSTTTH